LAETMHSTIEKCSHGMSKNLANSMWNTLFNNQHDFRSPSKIVK
jgi:hypothetical protein